MANIRGTHYYDYGGGDDQVMVAWKNGVVQRSVVGNAWKIAPGLALDGNFSSDVAFETFLDRTFIVTQYTDTQSWNGVAGSKDACVGAPRAQYVKAYQGRLYLYNISFGDNVFTDRAWFSDLSKNNTLTWGLEYGSNLAQTADSETVTSTGASFEKRNIKVGDPFTIVDGANAGEYLVASIEDAITIKLTENMPNTVADSNYWVGGNFIDINEGDGEAGKGMGIAANELFFFKNSTVWRFSASGGELRQIKNVVGTNAPESIVSHDDYIYWYHSSGIYRSSGSTAENISHALDDVVSSVSLPSATVAWVNASERTINFKLEDATISTNYISGTEDLELSYPVISFELEGQMWTIKNLGLDILHTCRGYYQDFEYIYGGNDGDTVYELDSESYFEDVKGTENVIPFEMELYPVYPAGSDTLIDFNRIRLYVMGRCEVTLLYKLYYKATGTSKDWSIDTGWKPLIGSQDGERSEWHFPTGSRASGVQLKIVENSEYNSFTIEKIMIYYSNPANY